MKRITASGEREEKRMEERVSDLFKREDGKRISGSREWMEYRSKWKEILQRELYGTSRRRRVRQREPWRTAESFTVAGRFWKAYG